MSRNTTQILLFISIILLLNRCAQVAPLTGGPRDMKPPEITASLPKSGTVNFKGNKIIIEFNEFIQLKDLSNQLIVSPLLKTTPEIEVRGKELVITLEAAELQPNTTYRLYLGNAVADMNESNSIPDFEYVFSTGSVIDTLQLKGAVRDALTGKLAAESIVTLYHAGRKGDSLAHKELPDYIARTNAQGEFTFRNLPRRSFKVFSIADKNKNYMLDGGTEKTAFLSDALNLKSDSTIELLQFDELLTKGFIKQTPTPFYGVTHIILNRKAQTLVQTLNPADEKNIYEEKKGQEKDTITLFYRHINDTLKVILYNKTFNKTDTVKITLPQNIISHRRKRSMASNLINGKLPLRENLKLRFNTWMDTSRVNLNAIKIESGDTAVKAPVPGGSWTGVNTFVFSGEFPTNTTYMVKIDTAAFFDPYGIANDSLKITFTSENELEFGKLTLKMLFDQKQPYIIQLLNDQQRVVRSKNITLSLSSSNAATLDFTDVTPGTYTIRVLFDDNGNLKWDTGDVVTKKQPEKVYLHTKPLKILSDWEIEEEIRVESRK